MPAAHRHAKSRELQAGIHADNTENTTQIKFTSNEQRTSSRRPPRRRVGSFQAEKPELAKEQEENGQDIAMGVIHRGNISSGRMRIHVLRRDHLSHGPGVFAAYRLRRPAKNTTALLTVKGSPAHGAGLPFTVINAPGGGTACAARTRNGPARITSDGAAIKTKPIEERGQH